MKSSSYYKYYRELMVGGNQYRCNGEWTSSFQTEPNKGSRLWRKSHRYKRQVLRAFALILVKWADWSANEGGTTGLPSFLDGGPFLFPKKYKKRCARGVHFFLILFREPGVVGTGKNEIVEWTCKWQLEHVSRAARSSTVKRIGYRTISPVFEKRKQEISVSNGGGTVIAKIALYMHKAIMRIEGVFFISKRKWQ